LEDTGRLWTILDDFGKLSCLECNVENITVLCINSAVPEYIGETVIILVLEIEGGTRSFNNSCEKCTKVCNNILVWKQFKFNLSLPGQINKKTLFYMALSQAMKHFLKVSQTTMRNFEVHLCNAEAAF
jgi:hypothetical protein